ncbi:hypothetical protein [Nonomuraea maritima]|uniref:hypothetical protein n=1 Tax=Nonomuraea maritima TaxID=683260 RepID=UPI00371A0EE7
MVGRLFVWAAAATTAAAPTLYSQFLSGGPTSYFYATMFSGWCAGHEINTLLRPAMAVVSSVPLFRYDGTPLIVLAFALWWLSDRRGRPGVGRAVARTAAGVLIFVSLRLLVPLLIDAATGPHCLAVWGPAELVSFTAYWRIYELVPPILVLIAVRSPRRAFVRRGRLLRVTAAVLTAAATFLVTAQAAPSGRISTEGELDCAGFGDGTARHLSLAETRFLCDVRGHNDFYGLGGIEMWARSPDAVVIAQGRRLCALAQRYGGNLDTPQVKDAPHGSLRNALGPLCPVAAAWQVREGERKQAEEREYYAKGRRACAAHPPHRPRIKPVRQRRTTMWTEFWEINAFDKGLEETMPDEMPERVADLVGSAPGMLSFWAADEIGHACVTVESYTRRPPVETRRWKQVVEVGYESPTGSLTLRDGNGNTLGGLIAGGRPGSYRVRVHLRGRELVQAVPWPPDGAVEMLIMVYPGERKSSVIYR